MSEKVAEPPHGCKDRAFPAKKQILLLEISDNFPPIKSHIFHFHEGGKSLAESGNFHFRQNEKKGMVGVQNFIFER